MKRGIASLALLTTLLVCSPSQGQDYEVSVTDVNVWVKVVDSTGGPVQGMKKEEFEIFEDGKKMNSECFEEIAISSVDDSEKSIKSGTSIASQNFTRRFVLFLDLFNTTHV